MWLYLLIAVIVIAVLWLILRPSCDFQIRLDKRGIEVNGQISQAQQHKIQEFFKDVKLSVTSAKICGRREQDGRLELRFRGDLRKGERQMIRNFLLSIF